MLIENPADRNDESMHHVHWAARAGHACVFETEELKAFQQASKAERITAPFCAFGAPVQKYFTVLATPGAAAVLAPIHGLVCTHARHEAHAYGTDAEGGRASTTTAPYPSVLCTVFAHSMLARSLP